MVRATCAKLLGKEAKPPSTQAEATVWMQAAKFLGKRIQGTESECGGRQPDMSAASADAMRTVLGQMEAAHKLISNREMVVNDITNSGSAGLKGGQLTQTNLTRVPSNKKATV